MCDIILCKKSYTRLTRNTRESKPRTLASLHCANTRDSAATAHAQARRAGGRGTPFGTIIYLNNVKLKELSKTLSKHWDLELTFNISTIDVYVTQIWRRSPTSEPRDEKESNCLWLRSVPPALQPPRCRTRRAGAYVIIRYNTLAELLYYVHLYTYYITRVGC